ncbi:MAG: ATP-binding cassette domain-containing protein [Candidatus Thiodiazotropha sp.]
MTEHSLELENLCFSYNSKEVLNQINFGVESSRIIAIIGGSGAGKTTLLKTILMLQLPEIGKITYFGTDTVSFEKGTEKVSTPGENEPSYFSSKAKDIRSRIGYVPQGSVLLPHKNLIDNVMLPLVEVHDMSRDNAAFKATEALARLGIDDLKLSRPWEVSGGQLQRAAIARALAVKPDLYLLDEPTGALDAANVEIVGTVLREDVRERGCSVVIVTHNLGFAQMFCDDVCLLQNGALSNPTLSENVDWSKMLRLIL